MNQLIACLLVVQLAVIGSPDGLVNGQRDQLSPLSPPSTIQPTGHADGQQPTTSRPLSRAQDCGDMSSQEECTTLLQLVSYITVVPLTHTIFKIILNPLLCHQYHGVLLFEYCSFRSLSLPLNSQRQLNTNKRC